MIALILTCGSRKTAAAEAGWYTKGDNLYYRDPQTGENAKGIVLIDGKYYYFSASGINYKGWRNVDGDRYYFLQSSGKMVQDGFVTWKENRYYLGPDGKLVRDRFITWKGDQYYIDSEGKMATGLCEAGGRQYLFSNEGQILRGWRNLNGSRYYFLQSNGTMVRNGFIDWRDNKYYFGPDGRMVTGFFDIKGKTYYFAEKTGEMLKGWRTIAGDRYYFLQGDGSMVRENFVTWRKNRYYFGSDGKMVKGLTDIRGKTYFFSGSTGEMLKGWRNIAGDRYYFLQGDGTMVRNHFVVWKSNQYYLGSDGKLVTDKEEYEINGKSYIIDSSGIALPSTECMITLCGNGGELLKTVAVREGLELELPSIKNPDGATFIGWSRSPGVRFTLNSGTHADYEPGDTITVSGNLRLYEAVFYDSDDLDIPQDAITLPSNKWEAVIFVGDSRQNYTDDASKTYQGIAGNIYYVAKGGVRFSWFTETGYSDLVSLIEKIRSNSSSGKPIAVIFNLGINDLRQPDLDYSQYVPFMRNIAPGLKESNCILFYMSVLPGNAEQLKLSRESGVRLPDMKEVKQFNTMIHSVLSSDYNYIDAYSWVMKYGYSSYDGLHFSFPTNRRVLNEVMKQVNARIQ